MERLFQHQSTREFSFSDLRIFIFEPVLRFLRKYRSSRKFCAAVSSIPVFFYGRLFAVPGPLLRH